MASKMAAMRVWTKAPTMLDLMVPLTMTASEMLMVWTTVYQTATASRRAARKGPWRALKRAGRMALVHSPMALTRLMAY